MGGVTHDTVYVALLRGVNLGARNKVPMAQLRDATESIGCTDVSTYIQSGNMVAASPKSARDLRTALEETIAERFGVHTTVMIRTAEEITGVVTRTPYPDAEDGTVHVGFLHEPPTVDALAPLTDIGDEGEGLTVAGREVYLYLPGGLGRSRLMVELGRRFKEPMTVRNWRTVGKLAQMSAPDARP